MKDLALFCVTLALVACFILGVWKLISKELNTIPTHKRFISKTFMTGNEKHFFGVLAHACENKFLICPQVSMGAIVDVKKDGLSNDEYWDLKKKFAMKIIDFVLCDKKTLEPLLIVELDDVSHTLNKDISRDAYTSHVGLKTLRLWSRNKPNAVELKKLIEDRLKGTI